MTKTSLEFAKRAAPMPATTNLHDRPTLLTEAELEWVAAAGGKTGASTNPVDDYR